MSIAAAVLLSLAGKAAILPGLLAMLLVVASLGTAVAAGLLPPRRANGPARIPPGRPAWPLLAVLFAALGVYLFSTAAFLGLRHPETTASATQSSATQPFITAGDDAVLSTVPPLLAFLALLIGDRAVSDATGQRLGLDARLLQPGLLRGAAGAFMVIPPLFLLSYFLEVVYEKLHYQHPAEHPLLKVLGEKPSPAITAAIVIGACLIAPLFEELLFRGHVQTLLRSLFHRLGTPRQPRPAPCPVVVTTPAEPGGFPIVESPPPDPALLINQPPPPRPWQTWAAILLTSALFAFVHPAWSRPVIFTLALCLGYAYERTRNLWVPITMHALFNSISTAIFLAGAYS